MLVWNYLYRSHTLLNKVVLGIEYIKLDLYKYNNTLITKLSNMIWLYIYIYVHMYVHVYYNCYTRISLTQSMWPCMSSIGLFSIAK